MLVKVIKNVLLVVSWIVFTIFFMKVMSLPSVENANYTQDLIGFGLSILFVWFAHLIRRPPKNGTTGNDWNPH
jgi:hypothetical protein